MLTARQVQGRIYQSCSPEQGSQPAAISAGKTYLSSGFARQRHLFRNLFVKTEELAELACLKRPGFQLLAELARAARDAARQADRELALGADPIHPYVPHSEQIEQLIERASDLQDRLRRQLALVAQWQDDAEELQHEFSLLVGQRQVVTHGVPFDGLRALARRLIAELLHDVTPTVLHPQLALDILTERLASRAQAQVFAVALASAQLVARVARVTWLGAEQVELITAAALLQDCGKLAVQSKLDSKNAGGVVPLHRHARIGAAIVGQYRNAPKELATLVARHHVRVGQMDIVSSSSKDLTLLTHLLAAASRFERLRINLVDRSTLLTCAELGDQPAMSQLWKETAEGHWDRSLVRKILVQRDGHQECMRLAESQQATRGPSRVLQFAGS